MTANVELYVSPLEDREDQIVTVVDTYVESGARAVDNGGDKAAAEEEISAVDVDPGSTTPILVTETSELYVAPSDVHGETKAEMIVSSTYDELVVDPL